MKNKYSKVCEICNCNSWDLVFDGKIRDGVFEKFRENSKVYQCSNCAVQRLSEDDCIPSNYYESGDYRKKLKQSTNVKDVIHEHEMLNKFTFEALGLISIRNKNIVDIGCGSGHLLDAVSGPSNKQVGIEPCSTYLDSIINKGFEAYSSAKDCIDSSKENFFDLGFSIQVIEHVLNPRIFLEEVRRLLKPGADLLISTPNRNDILMSILQHEFHSFFYRTQHRWYFDDKSIKHCAESAGFEVVDIKFIHRYGMANTLYWLRDKQPSGMKKIKGINSLADNLWTTYLNSTGQSDNLYIHLRVPI